MPPDAGTAVKRSLFSLALSAALAIEPRPRHAGGRSRRFDNRRTRPAGRNLRQTPEQKEQRMKRITKITMFTLGLVALDGLNSVAPSLRPLAELQAAGEQVLTLDVAIE